MNKRWIVFNQVLELVFNADKKEEPAEITLYDIIGKDPWTGRGITAEDFKAVLDETPRDRELHLLINSKGGDVHEGMAIKNMLEDWPKNVVCTIKGIAASTASWVPCNCAEVRAHKDSQMFIHDAMAFGGGNAADLRAAADKLDKTSDQIAGMYAKKCGRSVNEMRDMMRNKGGTLFTGQEAKDLGLVDTLIDGKAVKNFTQDEISNMRNQISAFYNSVAKEGAGQKQNNNMKNKLIAILNKHGVTAINGVAISNETPEEHLEAALEQVLNAKQTDADKARKDGDNVDLAAIRNEIKELKEVNKSLTEANQAARRLRVTNEIQLLITNDQLPASLKDKAITRAMADEEYLNELKALPARPPGAEPITHNIKADASITDKARHFSKLSPMNRAQFFQANRDGLIDFCNSGEVIRIMNAAGDNTIAAGLQRQVILQEIVRAFAAVIFPLRAFSTVFSNIALQGTDKINVPYYDLETAASTDWVAANGYVIGTTNSDTREIAVDKRKYQAMSVSSSLLRRQPFLNVMQLMMLKAEKLGVDVFKDVLSVVTLANYGAAAVAEAASAFDSDDVADLRGVANKAHWPEAGRSLIIDSDYDTNLTKDPSVKSALAFASNVAQTGKIPKISGFDYYQSPNIPDNAQTLKGMIVMPSAILVATSPVQPSDEVRSALSAYEIVVDPSTGIAFEYRRYGDPQMDVGAETVECNYGFAKGNDKALKRITE
jgi:ATP-dependent protease ClpP protease subunit